MPDRKFRIEGGRAGSITFDDPVGSGRFGWEMAFGDFSMGIEGCRWLTPSERPMEPRDIRRLLQEFSTEANIAVEVYFPQGAEGV